MSLASKECGSPPQPQLLLSLQPLPQHLLPDLSQPAHLWPSPSPLLLLLLGPEQPGHLAQLHMPLMLPLLLRLPLQERQVGHLLLLLLLLALGL
jgi:hypothetical protein